MRDILSQPENALQARTFYRTFITRIESKAADLVIHYEPARLLTQTGPVPSAVIWLPEQGSNLRPSD